MKELYERLAGEVGKVVVGQDEVVRRASLAPDAPDAAVREAALKLGFGEDEAAALIGDRSSHTALALGRALAKGRR